MLFFHRVVSQGVDWAGMHVSTNSQIQEVKKEDLLELGSDRDSRRNWEGDGETAVFYTFSKWYEWLSRGQTEDKEKSERQVFHLGANGPNTYYLQCFEVYLGESWIGSEAADVQTGTPILNAAVSWWPNLLCHNIGSIQTIFVFVIFCEFSPMTLQMLFQIFQRRGRRLDIIYLCCLKVPLIQPSQNILTSGAPDNNGCWWYVVWSSYMLLCFMLCIAF